MCRLDVMLVLFMILNPPNSYYECYFLGLLLGCDRLLGDLALTTLIKEEGTEASRNHGLLDVGVKY
jgi:hypothetical protein